MSRWKKIVLAVALVIVVLTVALYGFLALYDFNRFKPMIAKAVKDATGRELTIDGNIDFELGLHPTLVVEGVRFQNAAWSGTPNLAQVKRVEVQVAALPILVGKIDFAHIVLIEPALIIEFDSAGTSNLAFDTGTPKKDDAALSPPPLIFSDVSIENGRFSYRDARSDFSFSIRIDRLVANIPGLDQSLQLDFRGAFDAIPFALKGQIGPIWAWVEPGQAVPADITVAADGTTVRIKGELGDPTGFKDLKFTVAADGTSTADLAKLAGVTDPPELGAFKLAATVTDAEGPIAVNGLDIQVGSEAVVALSLTGSVERLLDLQGIRLNFVAQGQDVANLTQLGMPPPPKRGAFKVTAGISDPSAKMFAVSDLTIVLGENEINGLINLSLAEQIPYFTAKLNAPKFEFGSLDLDLKMTDLFQKPAIKKLDLAVGSDDIIMIRLDGSVNDLLELDGVDINFQANGKDLANLKQVSGQPIPIRGAFSAAGKVLIPVRKNLTIPELKVSVGKNTLSGSLKLDLSAEIPRLAAKLSAPKLNLPSILLPDLAQQGWAKGLGVVRPVNLSVNLAGFTQEIALEKVELRAGTLKSAELGLTGSIANLPDQRGIDLKFSLRGDNVNKLKDITGQPYFFAPIPGQGAYALSGHVKDTAANVYEINNFKLSMADTTMSGRLDLNLAGKVPTYKVLLAAPKFNLKPFPIPKQAAYANLNKQDDLGPLKIQSTVIVDGDRLSMPQLNIQAGSNKLAAVAVKGSIKNLTEQTGLDVDFDIQGDEVANLEKITGQSWPLKGPYGLSGKLSDPAPKKFQDQGPEIQAGCQRHHRLAGLAS